MEKGVLRIGIAGFGIIGKRRYHYINQLKDMKVVSVCDKVKPNSSELKENIKFYTDYRLMFMNESLDALFVCMTNDIAPKVTCEALENGLHVFCEKPPGKDVQSIEKVMEVESRHSGLKLMFGFNHRYHESIKDACSIIKSGELGQIINLRGVYGKAKMITFSQDNWRTKRSQSGGGVLLDQGIHMVDLMNYFAGDFIDIQSVVTNNFWKFDVEDNVYALMRTKKGVVAMLHSSATQWRHRFSLDINLEKGSINLGGILSGTKSYGSETMTIVWADPDKDYGNPKEQTTTYNYDSSWETEIKIFTDSIINDKVIVDAGSKDAYETMKLIYKIYYADPVWRDNYNIPNPNVNKF